jgi:hypothetical protein
MGHEDLQPRRSFVGVESGPKHVSTLCKVSQSERERGERASKVVRCSKKMCPIARSRGKKNSESIAFHYFGEIAAINLLVVQGSQSLVSLFSPAASGRTVRNHIQWVFAAK